MKIRRRSYQEIQIGEVFEFERLVSSDDVHRFAVLTGDENPLHIDPVYASTTPFKKNIVHGMLAGSLFSTLVGMYCPGERSLYLSQTLFFRQPIYLDQTVIVRGTVITKTNSMKVITLKTEVWRENELLISGEGKVKVL